MCCAISTPKRFLLADGVHTLAYGRQAVPTRVEHDAPAGGEDGANRMLRAAEARHRRIPVRKQMYAPAGPDPIVCFPNA